jgi:hypothetical protein
MEDEGINKYFETNENVFKRGISENQETELMDISESILCLSWIEEIFLTNCEANAK